MLRLLLSFSGRFLLTLLFVWGLASLVIFAVMEILPGDPASVMLGVGAREDTLQALRSTMGLNQPVYIRYINWIAAFVSGDFGTSYTYGTDVDQLVAERLALTLPLTGLSILIVLLVAIPLGTIAAAFHKGAVDRGLMAFAQLLMAVPNFWLGLILLLIFAVWLGITPAGGFPGWESPLLALRALILPALALALPQAAILARVTRGAVLETVNQDYFRTARAKGLPMRHAFIFHALPNSLIPMITIIGMQFSFLLAGGIVVENVFHLPGLGRLLFQAIAQRDLITVKAIVMLLVTTVIIVNLATEYAYRLIDPRLRP